jgi:hypothetical protein
MNLAHLHLLLNHFPSIGTIIALGLLLASVVARSGDLKRASLVLFVGIALLTVPVYVTGNAAQAAICVAQRGAPCNDPAVSRPTIEAHENAAFLSFAFIELTGGFAWLGLWQYRRRSHLPRRTLMVVMLLSWAALGLVSRAANMGGDIRHPEIRTGETVAVIGDTMTRQIGAALAGEIPWMWPAGETLHFIGLVLLFGIVLLVDLRVLGMMKSVPFSTLHRLLPWAILGYTLNTVTGMLFFVAGWDMMYTTSPVFHWKLALIVVAGANALYFTMFDAPWSLGAGDSAPATAKFAAASAIALWIGVIFCGHMLPFIGNAF